ncbi:hypothetical protein [Ralstonia phage phiRSL1]|uniref:Uncharacterized protein n=1 Tax=Ralstonia phage phiRSL1 TaxID=1980924 RepID=B2ZXW6_9CAUD|nr:hypothetical protein RSL1_ORF097 [Ralstonia phage phiRSL1]BAG41542.1 hypothetical protein [Ralstonia phage phiRSL1]
MPLPSHHDDPPKWYERVILIGAAVLLIGGFLHTATVNGTPVIQAIVGAMKL